MYFKTDINLIPTANAVPKPCYAKDFSSQSKALGLSFALHVHW